MSCVCYVKYTVIAFSILYWILGAITVSGGIWMLNDDMVALMFTQSKELFDITVDVILFAGLFTLISAWFACYGSIKKSKCIFGAFVFSLFIMMAYKILVGSWIAFNKDRISDLFTASVKYSIQQEYGEMSSTTVTFDVIQRNVQCCGADGPTDWMASQYNNVVGGELTDIAFSSLNMFYTVPESCCSQNISDVVCDMARKRRISGVLHAGINKEGCVRKLSDIASANSGLIFLLFVAVVALDIIFLAFSLCFCCEMLKKHNKHEMNS